MSNPFNTKFVKHGIYKIRVSAPLGLESYMFTINCKNYFYCGWFKQNKRSNYKAEINKVIKDVKFSCRKRQFRNEYCR